ncbi:DUF11 domain-containing protein [Agromyces cerinus]|uniref:Conserved repeat domain-containing protein n=1 Tax=Agromyces cerinus subsp. cerinus TaxID=232089 RepID=A0A1N6FA16_9MICO|nr:DUF11 domain-containing protein [Agromyces cerinus]SIN92125.1 conserved repeat domain-containing protein [Agromyces cerinus subsp. cerinus]
MQRTHHQLDDRTRRGPRALATLTALGLAAGAVLAGSLPVTAADAAPLDCLTPTAYVAQSENADGSGSTQLYSETYELGKAVFTEIGAPWGGQSGNGGRYNAIGFNTEDRQLYGISGSYDLAGTSTYDLLQIDEDGTVNNLGPLVGMPTNGAFINAGAFIDGGYYVGSFYSSELYKIDVDTGAVLTIQLGNEFTVADFTPVGGFLWGTNQGGMIERIDPVSGSVTSFSLNNVISAEDANAGAAFTFGNGNFGISSSSTGVVTQLAIGDPGAAAPTFTVVSQAAGPKSQRNDGASCMPAVPNTDLAIEKKADQILAPGGAITWAIRVTNNGPAISSGYTVQDLVPAGVTNVATSTEGCTVAGGSLTCVGSTLMVGRSADIVLTGTAPQTDSALIVNTASVIANEPDDVLENNTATAETRTQADAAADFTMKKTATLVDENDNELADAGEKISYAFEVTNTGNVPLSGLAIKDPLGGAVTCDVTSLAPAASTSCATDEDYVVTAADVKAGSVVNVATATVTPPTGVANPGQREDTATTRTGEVPVVVTPPTTKPVVPGTPSAGGAGLASTGTEHVGTLVNLAAAVLLGAGALLGFARYRRRRGVHGDAA